MIGRKSVIVVGAGISGLCAAYWLKQKGFHVTVLEKDSEPGGTMQTIHDSGWLIETGPNSALETTLLLKQLAGELGVTSQWSYANDTASKRYVVRNGRLHPIPMGPGAFVATKLWTLGGKLRLFKEPFIGRAPKEETIAEFVERRLGTEFLDYAINPFVAGVYAGDPRKLSVQTAFPKLYALEAKYGGLIKGAIRSRKERKKRKEIAKDRAKLFSFINGMQTLPNRLASTLGNALKLCATVESIIPQRADHYPTYIVSFTQDGVQQTIQADAVVLSAPAHAAANILRPIDPELASMLDSIYYPPVAEVFFGFRQEQIKRPLDGFGFLVPEVEQRRILGTIWSSSLFPNRAPKGHVALTTFVGGARQSELVDLGDNDLSSLVTHELHQLMSVEAQPSYTKIIRWQRAIPQYNLGYFKILQAIDRFEQNFRGAFICSNYRGGIAVGDCVINADKTVQRLTELMPVS